MSLVSFGLFGMIWNILECYRSFDFGFGNDLFFAFCGMIWDLLE